MQQEALQAPEVVNEQLCENMGVIKELVKCLKNKPPKFVYTIARGSSDHAAYFANYLFSTQTGLVTASLPPSINSLYHTKLHVGDALAIGISQSGVSPDICSALQAAKEGGATTVAIVNNVDSVLANIADFVIPMHAGTEHAVAASKTFIASLSAIAQLIASYSGNKDLLRALPHLPETLEQASQCDWSVAQELLSTQSSAFMLARGYGFPVAQEAALKFKETADIHAEAYSSAEFQHGPMALAKPTLPLFFLAQADATLPGLVAFCQQMTELKANTLLACAKDKLNQHNVAKYILPLPNSLHSVLDPIACIQAFYPMMAQLAVQRGFNPDQPEHLRKITETY
jgi:glucosamine--fructose-6-phosphate aminotransferase (isomerizing)